jgi:coproporphyrinogen III oxidase-like Fe-S oxidoreductase
VSKDDEVARERLPFEYMLNALRLREGFDAGRLHRAHRPAAVEPCDGTLQQAQARGLVVWDRSGAAQRARLRLSSDLQAMFLPPT